MTIKQLKFVKAYAKNGGNGQAAAIASGSSPKAAKVYACETLKKMPVQTYLYRLMDKKGLSDDHLVSNLKDGLDATKIISAVIIQPKGTNAVEPTEASSRTMDFEEVPDWTNRHKYLETAFKLKGHLRTTDEPPGPRSVTIVYGHHVAAQTIVKVTPEPPHADGS